MQIYYDAAKLAHIVELCWNTNIQRKEVTKKDVDLKPFEGKEDWRIRKIILEDAYSCLLELERENALLEKEQCFILKQRYIKTAYCVLEHPTELNRMEKCAVELDTSDILILEKDLVNGYIILTPAEVDKMMQYWLPLDSKGAKNEPIHIDYIILYEDKNHPYTLIREIYTGNEPMRQEVLLKPFKIVAEDEDPIIPTIIKKEA
jgi:hypothetical protein